ncbi:MAG TPA: hypothetical protein VIF12_01650, partial [Micavibrio sp.]
MSEDRGSSLKRAAAIVALAFAAAVSGCATTGALNCGQSPQARAAATTAGTVAGAVGGHYIGKAVKLPGAAGAVVGAAGGAL